MTLCAKPFNATVRRTKRLFALTAQVSQSLIDSDSICFALAARRLRNSTR
jgi:hypothetical protein